MCDHDIDLLDSGHNQLFTRGHQRGSGIENIVDDQGFGAYWANGSGVNDSRLGALLFEIRNLASGHPCCGFHRRATSDCPVVGRYDGGARQLVFPYSVRK